MSSLATCIQGHRWETANNNPASGDGVCPVCGGPALASEAKTLAPPMRSSEPATLPPAPTLAQSEITVSVIGYEILGELGRGGMGVVYKARQVKADRLVALKMILAGAHASEQDLNRFRTEAHAVARMQHPNIVQVYEVGEQDALPFFSLEFLEGGSLADRLDGTPWPASKAAELVETLARAMQAAHDKGIVHRDLKPANILLTTDGTPKITDFGLAKRLDSAGQTQTGAIMGTPSYMAPEQAGGKGKEVGPAADVYALGAILYELLTGRPPFGAETPLDTVLQVINDEPVAPSRLQSKTPRDLETICLKCLEKSSLKRYPRTEALAEDLRRFQTGQPLLARPVGRMERTGKWVKRNPVMAGLLTFVALSLILGTSSSLIAMVQAKQAAAAEKKANELAQQRLKQIANANTILASIFKHLDPREEEKEGKSLRVVLGERLTDAVQQLEGTAIGDPLEVARIQIVLASSLQELGHFDQAEMVFSKAAATQEKLLGGDDLETLSTKNDLAGLYQVRARYEQAEPLFEEVLEARRKKLGENHPDTLGSLHNLATNHWHRGRYDKAESLEKQVLDGEREKLGADDTATLSSMNNLTVMYRERGRYDEAESLLKQVLEAQSAKLGAEHPDTLKSMNNLATLYSARRMFDKAQALHERVLELRRRKLGADHPDTLSTMNNLAVWYGNRGRFADAESLYKQVLEVCRIKLGTDHANTLSTMDNLAVLYRSMNKLDKAIPLFEETLKLQTKKLGENHPDTLYTQAYLGITYRDAGRLEDGIRCLEAAMAGARNPSGALSADLARVPSALANTYDQAKQFAKSEALYREFLDRARKEFGPDDPRTAGSLAQLGMNLLQQKRHAEAEKVLRECLAIREKIQPDEWTTFNTKSMLGEALAEQKKYTEAEPMLVQSLEGMKLREDKIPRQAKGRLNEALKRLVQLYDLLGKPNEAAKWRKELEARNAKAAGQDQKQP
jgi:tetratricopeptide (TPR) repeat protein/tRNA A-37 threonylcarbamoyl transferase component Bud32